MNGKEKSHTKMLKKHREEETKIKLVTRSLEMALSPITRAGPVYVIVWVATSGKHFGLIPCDVLLPRHSQERFHFQTWSLLTLRKDLFVHDGKRRRPWRRIIHFQRPEWRKNIHPATPKSIAREERRERNRTTYVGFDDHFLPIKLHLLHFM